METTKETKAQKRHQTTVVQRYLNALVAGDPRQTNARLHEQLAKAQTKLDEASNPLDRLALHQKVIDIKRALRANSNVHTFTTLEDEFIKEVASYSERKGLTYMAWRSVGVPAHVLREGGVPRNRVD